MLLQSIGSSLRSSRLWCKQWIFPKPTHHTAAAMSEIETRSLHSVFPKHGLAHTARFSVGHHSSPSLQNQQQQQQHFFMKRCQDDQEENQHRSPYYHYSDKRFIHHDTVSNFPTSHRKLHRSVFSTTISLSKDKSGTSSGSNSSSAIAEKLCEVTKQINDRDQLYGPSIEVAREMPISISQASNQTIMTLAAQGDYGACSEVLKRHIMATDNIPYAEACKVFKKISKDNRKGTAGIAYVHYTVALGAIAAGFLSLPLVFDLNVVHFFNKYFVTADVPEPEDLETTLEVGSWAWNWMEPPLGTLSFFLLCMQFAASEFEFLGVSPIHDYVRSRRAKLLVNLYPQYDAQILTNFSKSEKFFVSRSKERTAANIAEADIAKAGKDKKSKTKNI